MFGVQLDRVRAAGIPKRMVTNQGYEPVSVFTTEDDWFVVVRKR